jgi:hypothetical protein
MIRICDIVRDPEGKRCIVYNIIPAEEIEFADPAIARCDQYQVVYPDGECCVFTCIELSLVKSAIV